jgi:hypothetical protein
MRHPLKGKSRKKHLSWQKKLPFLLGHSTRISTALF